MQLLLISLLCTSLFSFAGNEENVTRTVRVLTPTVTSLSLSSSNTALNVGETTDLSLEATYSNNTSKTLTNNIEWIVTPSDAVQITNSTLQAKKDTNVTVQAKVGTVLSNTITLNITWVVDGHVLPPEPDKALNDSTLLGIDVNDNGVRDDVERWIYETYKDKHPIHVDIGMQAARGYKLVLETPEKAKEIEKELGAPIYCEGYFSSFADKFGDKIYIHQRIIDDNFDKKYFNNEERIQQYMIYQNVLSGDSYTVPWPSEGKKYCDFNTSKYEE